MLLAAGAVLYFSPWVVSEFGVGALMTEATQSFTYDGYNVQLAGAYADSWSTVINLKASPPGMVFGRTYLTDQFGNMYPEEDGEPGSSGDMALSYKPATWLTAVTGMRYTLNVERVKDTTVVQVSKLQGTVLFNRAPTLQAQLSGTFGPGTITFLEVRYGGRVVAVLFDVQGVSVVGGYLSGEASLPPRPGLEVQLVPVFGGAAKNMPYRTSVDGNVTHVHAVAMLVDPGEYTVILSIKGVARLERTLRVS